MMRSISGRLTLRFSLTSSILLAVMAASLYAWIDQGLAARFERELATQFAMFQERFTAESGGTPKGVGDELRSFRSTTGAAAEIHGPHGILFQSPGFREDLPGFRMIGIEAEHRPKLFRCFYRTDKPPSGETGGAGLGLAIAKSFTEAHGGKIQVQSAPGVGTTFTLLFPAAAE